MRRTIVIALAAAISSVAAAAAGPTQHRLMIAQTESQHPTEAVLREIIAQLRAGNPDYATLEPALEQAIRQQMPNIRALLDQLGPLQRLDFIGTQSGLDLYRGVFANGATIWAIGMSPARKIAALSLRPDSAASAAPDPNGIEVATAGLSGTLRKPANAERPPVVLLIAGSGPTDRNGNQAGREPNELRQLADALAERGIASLRYDKRAVGRSTVPASFREDALTIDSFVDDAAAWLTWLEQRGDLGPRFVAGHSEGGLIAILLAKRTALDGIVLMAAGSVRSCASSCARLPCPSRCSTKRWRQSPRWSAARACRT
jgi:uncharacterized protein